MRSFKAQETVIRQEGHMNTNDTRAPNLVPKEFKF